MERTNLNQEELNKRCNEVFTMLEGDLVYDVVVTDDGTVKVQMSEKPDCIIFDFEPNMEGRPEALDYILGNRNDFDD